MSVSNTAQSMTIVLNGEPSELAAGETVSSLLDNLRRDARTVAVEHNGEILSRDLYPTVVLQGGDRLEIVGFVQGG